MFRIFSFLTKILNTSELIDIHTTPALSVSNPWKFGKLRVKTFDAIEFQTPEVIKKTPCIYKKLCEVELGVGGYRDVFSIFEALWQFEKKQEKQS